ncbi:hypothetical protein GMO_11730 [Gluconobacter morbifer G707]|uniref:Uncharacterized protein n=1 Tax=Gluconobacter morbifer G707 TaxID=1088869 RepID=G6XIX3_9PROT|nr:hypothetical protein GMO_11730 [Gluconobacter morbifer G707]
MPMQDAPEENWPTVSFFLVGDRANGSYPLEALIGESLKEIARSATETAQKLPSLPRDFYMKAHTAGSH